MKRPEGFGRPAAPPSESRPAPTPRPRAADPRPTDSRPAPKSSTPRGGGSTRKPAPTPSGSERTREADARLREARKERKRQERVELRRFTRRTRRRRLAWLAAGTVTVLLIGLLAVAVYSPLLALREIRIDGTARLDAVAVQDAVDGQLGTPLALLDDARITRELSEFALIRSYTTEVLPPGTLAIHIVERQPIAVVTRGASFDLVDPAGIVVESSAARPEGVPLIQLGAAELGDKAFLAMTDVLLALPDDVLARVDAIAATTKDDVTLSLVGTSQRVVWGSSERAASKAKELAFLLGIHGAGGAGEYDVSAPGSAVFRPD